MALPFDNDRFRDSTKRSLTLDGTGVAAGFVAPVTAAADFVAPGGGFLMASGKAAAGSAAAAATALYIISPNDTVAISPNDLHQDGLGDCFLISSIGELAMTHAASVQNMIQVNSNGTETVTLYEDANGKLPVPGYTGAFKAVTEVVTNSFNPNSVNSAAGQDVVNGVKEIWPQVIEQAVAQLNGGISAIANGGYPFVAMEELTGKAATWIYQPATSMTGAQLFSQLSADVKANDMLTFDTTSSPTGFNLVGGHCYMFDGMTGSGASATVTLLNPWGTDQPGKIQLSQLAGNICQIDVGHS